MSCDLNVLLSMLLYGSKTVKLKLASRSKLITIAQFLSRIHFLNWKFEPHCNENKKLS